MHGLFRVLTAFSTYNRKHIGVEPGILCNGLKNVTKGLRDVKEGGISDRKAGLLWGVSMEKSTLQARLNRRVTLRSLPHAIF